MSEASYQKKIIALYEKQGYYVIKLMQTNKNGIPDLICLKENEILFIEVKAANGRLSELQVYRHIELEKKGFKVITLFAK